jgi:hypothetical protein
MEGRNAQELETKIQEACEPLWDVGGYAKSRETLEWIIGHSLDINKFLNDGVSIQWAKAIYLALESDVSGKASSLDISKLHVEHIAPKKATQHWQSVFSDDSRSYSEIVADIGNLTILDGGLNQVVKQDPFVEKATEYKKSRSNLTNDLSSLASWPVETIDARRDWVAESLENLLQVEPKPVTLFTEWLKKP